jgi:hypothetical protein
MADKDKPQPPQTDAAAPAAAELNNPDFQVAMKALLDAYQPVLEQQVNLIKNPQDLQKQVQTSQPTCAQEFAEAYALFQKFFTEDVAQRLLPAQARELLGPIDQWRWCYQHIICCLVFGWLVCRWPRTFRGYAYYLYEYWKCVRQVIGNPVNDPPTEEQRRDFETLVNILAGAFKPYLTDQLATVEYPAAVPEEVISGKIDCFTDDQDTCAIFERLLTTDAARALLGSAAFEKQSQQKFFWFCRCWCLCALCFGCCLGRARNIQQVVWCLYRYFLCLRDCFQPIRCDLTAPTGCAEEQPNLPGFTPPEVGLAIVGTAAGAFFDHYTLLWRQTTGGQTCEEDGWNNGSTGLISYPGGGSTGTIPVVSGTLGWIDTTFLPTGNYDIRLDVYSASGQDVCHWCITFTLFKKLVFISRIAENPGAFVQTPPGPFDENAQIVSSNPAPPGVVVPVGGEVSVWGAAFVGECANRKIKCFDLRAAIDFQVGPEDPGFAATLPLYTIEVIGSTNIYSSPCGPGPICYDDVPPLDQIKKRLWRLDSGLNELTVCWQHVTSIPGQPWFLKPDPFESQIGLPLAVSAGGCPDPHHRCRSGKYTILLDVTDTTLKHYYDTQQVWFDNKPMFDNVHAVFHGLEGLPSCTDLHLNPSQPYIPPGAPCNVPWPENLLGIAYDEYIDEFDLSYPSDNFDYYYLIIYKQTGEFLYVPITIAPDPLNPLHGLMRRGQPGVRCEPLPAGGGGCPPGEVVPGQSFDVLTALDMRVFDAVCAPSVPAPYSIPATFPLPRGTCCGYTFQLYAQDKTWSDGSAGGYHHAWSYPWAVCICNDLPATGS